MMDIEFVQIDFKSPFYMSVLELRNEVLRKPIGLNLMDEDLSEDETQQIFIAKNENKIIACLMLKKNGSQKIKLRQMAVDKEFQYKGIGAKLVKIAEQFCLQNNYGEIELHARHNAILFYKKLGYEISSNEFEEVGMPHFKMSKTISTK
jgi:predicted GNAT family N-acyltransferase